MPANITGNNVIYISTNLINRLFPSSLNNSYDNHLNFTIKKVRFKELIYQGFIGFRETNALLTAAIQNNKITYMAH